MAGDRRDANLTTAPRTASAVGYAPTAASTSTAATYFTCDTWIAIVASTSAAIAAVAPLSVPGPTSQCPAIAAVRGCSRCPATTAAVVVNSIVPVSAAECTIANRRPGSSSVLTTSPFG